MTDAAELEVIRRAFGKQIPALAGVREPRIEAAFAAVPREHFLGPGPWQMMSLIHGSYAQTPDDDPVYLYTNGVIAIVPEKRLNNGEPSLYAKLYAEASPRDGEHAVHIGAGVGYYSALLAQLVGPSGRVTAIECEPELAERARRNCARYPNIEVMHGNGVTVEFDAADLILVSAGATRPADPWLERLTEGGRLVLPLTTSKNIGATFRIERRGDDYLAARVSPIMIYPCAGARDEASEQALSAAIRSGDAKKVTRLYRGELPPPERCWLRGPDWCLAYD
jgi:protein-L-isoaspartate(D-aspartate) O-methyltransferase